MPLEFVTEKILEAVFGFLRAFVTILLAENEPDIGASWFLDKFATMMNIGAFLTLPMLMVATVNSLLKGGMSALLRTYLVAMPVALLGSIVALAGLGLIQEISNNMVAVFDNSAKANLEKYIDSIDNVGDSLKAIFGLFFLVGTLGGLAIIFGLFALWIELITRGITIYMSVLFLPVAFGMAVWEPARRWLIILLELAIVVIFSKAIIMATLSLGFAGSLAAFGGEDAGGTGGISARTAAFLTGPLIIWTSALSMPMLIRLIMSPRSGGLPLDRQSAQRQNPLSGESSLRRSEMIRALRGSSK